MKATLAIWHSQGTKRRQNGVSGRTSAMPSSQRSARQDSSRIRPSSTSGAAAAGAHRPDASSPPCAASQWTTTRSLFSSQSRATHSEIRSSTCTQCAPLPVCPAWSRVPARNRMCSLSSNLSLFILSSLDAPASSALLYAPLRADALLEPNNDDIRGEAGGRGERAGEERRERCVTVAAQRQPSEMSTAQHAQQPRCDAPRCAQSSQLRRKQSRLRRNCRLQLFSIHSGSSTTRSTCDKAARGDTAGRRAT